jgi:predicted nucleic acid-binding Zn ribbon protein
MAGEGYQSAFRNPLSAIGMSGSSDGKPGRPSLVGEVLNRYLSRSGLAAKVEAASVIPEWEDRVGPQIAAVTTPLRVSEGTLFVGVATSAWLMELNLMKDELMRRINAGKKDGRIRQIVLVMNS